MLVEYGMWMGSAGSLVAAAITWKVAKSKE